MTRWIGWTCLAAGVIAAGYLASLNPDPIALTVAPGRVVQIPLGVLLTGTMVAGALAIGAAATLAGLRRTWAALAARRRVRAARRAELLAETTFDPADLTAAVSAAEHDLAERPGSPRRLRRLRDLYARAERWTDALAMTERLVVHVRIPALLEDEVAALRALRYQVALAEPDALRAARALRTLAREDPGFVASWVSAGDRLLEAGRHVRARRTWASGAGHHPAPVLLARLEAHDAAGGRAARTTRLYRRLRRRHPDDPTLPLLFARYLLRTRQTAEAAALLEMPLASPAAEALRGELARQQGDFERAAAALAHALGSSFGLEAGWTCRHCGTEAAAWAACCPRCARWNTLGAGTRTALPVQDSLR